MLPYIWFFALCSLFVIFIDAQDVDEYNQYIDEVLTNLKNHPEFISRVDPLRLSDTTYKKIMLTNIAISGIKTLHRSGDCMFSIDENEKISLECQLAINDISFEANYQTKPRLKGKIEAFQPRLEATLLISYDTKTDTKKVERLTVTDFQEIKIKKLKGLSFLLNWLLKIIAQKKINEAKEKIIYVIEQELSKYIEDIMEKFKLTSV